MADNKGKVALKNPFELQKKRERSTSKKIPVKKILRDGKEDVEEISHDTSIEGVFKRYTHLSEISSKIAEELIGTSAYNKPADMSKALYEKIREDGLTFFMSRDTKRTGLLSLFPALSTGIKLYSKMPSESKTKTELLPKIKSGLDAVFKFIYRDANWRENPNLPPVFDASPYEPYEDGAFYAGSDVNDFEGRSYIDSISWAVTLFPKIMHLVDENKKPVFDKEYRDEAKKLIKWCLSYVNNAVLTIDAKDKDDNDKDYKRPVGWNFSKIATSSQNAKVQSSLYFTYAAASIYVALYEEYKDILDNLQTLNRAFDKMSRDKKERFKDIIENLQEQGGEDKKILLKKNNEQAEKAIEDYAKILERDDEDKAEELRDALEAFKKCDKRKLEEYYFFNDDKSAEYNGKIYKVEELNSLGPISKLKWNLEKISSDIWEKAKDLLENNFVYDDMQRDDEGCFIFKEATPEAIQSGGQTNALFAGLLLISICLYSKYDFVVFYTEDNGTGRFGKKAYDDMQNIMLLHVQRAQRFFDKLSEKGKAFGVDFLILRFSEDFSDEDKGYQTDRDYLTDREMAERLRKQLIRITSLTPMLLKTNNLISQYVVQYPQKQMGEAIAKIGEKRFYERNMKTEDENKKYRWFWESDGYHAMSNYYYVGAIFDFYAYYDDYEAKYIKHLEELKTQLSEDIEYTKSVQAYYQKITDEMERSKAQLIEDYDKQLKAKDDEIQEERDKAKKSEIGEKLVSDIGEAVKNAFDEPEFLKKIIIGIRKQLAEEVFERYSKDPQEDKDVLEKLKKSIEPKDDSFFSLLRAFAADIILQSAIEASLDRAGQVDKDKLGIFEGFKPAKVALYGGEQLIKGGKGDKDGLINNLFATMCEKVDWNKVQKTKQEK